MPFKLKIGVKAPDFDFETPWKGASSFYSATGNRPAVLFFLRYIGCPICQMEMANIKRDIHHANQMKANVFVVLQSSPDSVAAIANEEDWPFTIVCDPQARIFTLYSVERGGIFTYLNPVGIAAVIKAMATGYGHGKFEGRETQLPASFVITADKAIGFAYYGKRINDVPSLAALMENVD